MQFPNLSCQQNQSDVDEEKANRKNIYISILQACSREEVQLHVDWIPGLLMVAHDLTLRIRQNLQ
jgi:hypothetical protein